MVKNPYNASGGMVGKEYELDGVDEGEIEPLEPALRDVSDIPDHEVAERRKAFIYHVRMGAKPDRVALVLGFPEGWREDETLCILVDRAEAAFVCEMEIKAANEIRKHGKLAAGVKFLFESRAGYTTKPTEEKVEDEAQNVTVIRRVEKGTEEEPTPAPMPDTDYAHTG